MFFKGRWTYRRRHGLRASRLHKENDKKAQNKPNAPHFHFTNQSKYNVLTLIRSVEWDLSDALLKPGDQLRHAEKAAADIVQASAQTLLSYKSAEDLGL